MSPISLLNHILHIQETYYLRKVGKKKTSKGMIIELTLHCKKTMKAETFISSMQTKENHIFPVTKGKGSFIN
jgi:hypothetical protein